MTIDGPTDSDVFLAYVERIDDAKAELICFPPYSPDLHPIVLASFATGLQRKTEWRVR